MILHEHVRKISDSYRVTDGIKFRLKNYDPADTAGHQHDKPLARALLEGGVQRLSAQQEKLDAQDRWAMLCCFQAMDAAGKDGTIKHVMSGIRTAILSCLRQTRSGGALTPNSIAGDRTTAS
jgi:polyphosphate kinase 2 (PPK2 family)